MGKSRKNAYTRRKCCRHELTQSPQAGDLRDAKGLNQSNADPRRRSYHLSSLTRSSAARRLRRYCRSLDPEMQPRLRSGHKFINSMLPRLGCRRKPATTIPSPRSLRFTAIQEGPTGPPHVNQRDRKNHFWSSLGFFWPPTPEMPHGENWTALRDRTSPSRKSWAPPAREIGIEGKPRVIECAIGRAVLVEESLLSGPTRDRPHSDNAG